MIGISFKTWTSSHGGWISWYRIYHNWKWTPFIWGIPRYCEATHLPKRLEPPADDDFVPQDRAPKRTAP